MKKSCIPSSEKYTHYGSSRRGKRASGKLLKEIMTENFPKLGRDTGIQLYETHKSPNRFNPKRTSPRCIIIKLSKIKDRERNLKAAREKKHITYKRTPIRISADFSAL